MLVSVVIPTYNRLPILKKCLLSLENQSIKSPSFEYEVIVVDDGSTDGTSEWLHKNKDLLPHVILIEQKHGGPAIGRNKGVNKSKGEVIVFIDSDLVVESNFLSNHIKSLSNYWNKYNNKFCFTYGTVINTVNFNNPTSERYKLKDISWAYFATGNVAIDKNILLKSGLFDPDFCLYGWEDLELGERLRKMGVILLKCPKAVGYHWHPAFTLDQIPNLIRVEKERAKMGLVFYNKHPTLRVRFIIQYTILHRILWETLTVFGFLNEKRLKPLLRFLINRGYYHLALELLRVPLNLIAVRQIYKEAHLARRT